MMRIECSASEETTRAPFSQQFVSVDGLLWTWDIEHSFILDKKDECCKDEKAFQVIQFYHCPSQGLVISLLDHIMF